MLLLLGYNASRDGTVFAEATAHAARELTASHSLSLCETEDCRVCGFESMDVSDTDPALGNLQATIRFSPNIIIQTSSCAPIEGSHQRRFGDDTVVRRLEDWQLVEDVPVAGAPARRMPGGSSSGASGDLPSAGSSPSDVSSAVDIAKMVSSGPSSSSFIKPPWEELGSEAASSGPSIRLLSTHVFEKSFTWPSMKLQSMPSSQDLVSDPVSSGPSLSLLSVPTLEEPISEAVSSGASVSLQSMLVSEDVLTWPALDLLSAPAAERPISEEVSKGPSMNLDEPSSEEVSNGPSMNLLSTPTLNEPISEEVLTWPAFDLLNSPVVEEPISEEVSNGPSLGLASGMDTLSFEHMESGQVSTPFFVELQSAAFPDVAVSSPSEAESMEVSSGPSSVAPTLESIALWLSHAVSSQFSISELLSPEGSADLEEMSNEPSIGPSQGPDTLTAPSTTSSLGPFTCVHSVIQEVGLMGYAVFVVPVDQSYGALILAEAVTFVGIVDHGHEGESVDPDDSDTCPSFWYSADINIALPSDQAYALLVVPVTNAAEVVQQGLATNSLVDFVVSSSSSSSLSTTSTSSTISTLAPVVSLIEFFVLLTVANEQEFINDDSVHAAMINVVAVLLGALGVNANQVSALLTLIPDGAARRLYGSGTAYRRLANSVRVDYVVTVNSQDTTTPVDDIAAEVSGWTAEEVTGQIVQELTNQQVNATAYNAVVASISTPVVTVVVATSTSTSSSTTPAVTTSSTSSSTSPVPDVGGAVTNASSTSTVSPSTTSPSTTLASVSSEGGSGESSGVSIGIVVSMVAVGLCTCTCLSSTYIIFRRRVAEYQGTNTGPKQVKQWKRFADDNSYWQHDAADLSSLNHPQGMGLFPTELQV